MTESNLLVSGQSNTEQRQNQHCKVGTPTDRSKVLRFCRGEEWHTHEPKIPTSPRRVSSTKITKSTDKIPGDGPVLQAFHQQSIQRLSGPTSTEDSDLFRDARLGHWKHLQESNRAYLNQKH